MNEDSDNNINDFKTSSRNSSGDCMEEVPCNTRGPEPCNPSKSLEVQSAAYNSTTYSQYTRVENKYFPCGKTIPLLNSGIYTPHITNEGTPFFIQEHVQSDLWLQFQDSLIAQVESEISKFWNNKARFAYYGYLHRRGYMLYGPPGTGKTVLVKQIMNRIVENKGLVILGNTHPEIVTKALKLINDIEPDRQIVCVFEDIDAIISNYGESKILSLLDGEDAANHVLNIATTNYPEKLDRRIIGRPRRFDRLIKIGYPDEKMRSFYFENQLKIEKAELQQWVNATNNFTFAALTELVISVKCLDNPFDESVKKIRSLIENKASSSEYKQELCGSGVGFAAR